MNTSEEKHDEINRDMAILRKEYAELRTTIIGIDGRNGLRSEIKKLREDFDAFVTKVRQYKYERQETCYGVKLVAELREELAKKETEERKDMQLDAETKTALLSIAENSKNNRRNSIITIIGIVCVFAASVLEKIL